jgi:tetratricopeptide (TPR) repeat protein
MIRRALGHLARRFELEPTSEVAATLARTHLDLAVLLARSNRGPEAWTALEAAGGHARRASELPGADPTLPAMQAAIESHRLLAEGRRDEAVQRARASAGLLETLHARDDARPGLRESLSSARFRLAWILGMSTAGADRDEAVALAQHALELDPHDAANHHRLGVLLLATGRNDEAERAFRAVLELAPESPDARNSLAWALATSPRPLEADRASEAVELARRAVGDAAQVGLYWNTLGVALYRQGRWPDAIAALERSMNHRAGGDSFDWFFLAMTHWRLGQPEQARLWLGRAVQWLARNRPGDGELLRFREQALQLIEGTTPRLDAWPFPIPLRPLAGECNAALAPMLRTHRG